MLYIKKYIIKYNKTDKSSYFLIYKKKKYRL